MPNIEKHFKLEFGYRDSEVRFVAQNAAAGINPYIMIEIEPELYNLIKAKQVDVINIELYGLKQWRNL